MYKFVSFWEEVIDILKKYLNSPFVVDKIRAFVAGWYFLHRKIIFFSHYFEEFGLLEALQQRG